jgi:hypothetical protein
LCLRRCPSSPRLRWSRARRRGCRRGLAAAAAAAFAAAFATAAALATASVLPTAAALAPATVSALPAVFVKLADSVDQDLSDGMLFVREPLFISIIIVDLV